MWNYEEKDSWHRYPVVLIPGADHADFLYGDPPSKVKETDLRSEISPEAAIEQISYLTAAFITMTRMGSSPAGQAATKLLDEQIEMVSGPMLTPVIDLYKMEGASFISGFNKTTPFSRVA